MVLSQRRLVRKRVVVQKDPQIRVAERRREERKREERQRERERDPIEVCRCELLDPRAFVDIYSRF